MSNYKQDTSLPEVRAIIEKMNTDGITLEERSIVIIKAQSLFEIGIELFNAKENQFKNQKMLIVALELATQICRESHEECKNKFSNIIEVKRR